MPRQIEVVAGIIEAGEDPVDVALRGCVREHCCWIKVLVHDDDILTSLNVLSEFVSVCCGCTHFREYR